jgi:N-acetylglutamate synthase-like GNAT family acetyltransferase
MGWTSEADLVAGERTDARQVLGMIGRPGCRVLVVERDGNLIACCQVERRDRRVAHFGTFAVAPTRQGAGIGRWLIGQAETVASAEFGSRTMELFVLTQQTALVAWYQRLGFARTGDTRPFPAHSRYARPLRDDLRFEVLRKPIVSRTQSS